MISFPQKLRNIQKKSDTSFGEFVALIAFLMALVAFAINMILPAFPNMAASLGIQNLNDVQLTVSLLYLGMALGQVIFGPLSDNIGRKPAIYMGLSLFLVGCLISYFATSLNMLLTGQVIQGIGLGAPRIVTVAMVRDKYVGVGMARVMSFIMVVFILVPTISPALGQGVLLIADWRAIFFIFSLLAVIMLFWLFFRQPETLVKNNLKEREGTPGPAERLVAGVREVFKTRVALGYTLLLGFSSSAFIAYLNLSQQVFQGQYKLGTAYPLYFAVLSLSIGAASFLNGKLVMRYGAGNMTRNAIFATAGAGILYAGVTFVYQGHPPFWSLMGFMTIVLFSFGILVGNLNALAMEPLGHIAGIGAALVGALSTLFSVPLAILIGGSYNGSVLPLVGGFAVFGSLSIPVFYWINKKPGRV